MQVKKASEKQFSVSFSDLYAMLEFVRDYVTTIGFDQKWIYKIELVVEEALVNIIKYSQLTKKDTVTISCQIPERPGIQIVIREEGIPYNPLSREKVDIHKKIPLEERPIGGFGIHLMRVIMDRLEYRYEGKSNILTMTKFLNKE